MLGAPNYALHIIDESDIQNLTPIHDISLDDFTGFL